MIEFFARFFKRESSGSTAKERLRLVLLSDHLSLAPEMVEALKRDLIEVISRYVEVDAQACDVSFEQQERAVAMLANIPILGVPHGNGRPPRNGHPRPAFEAAPGGGAGAPATAVLEPPPAVTAAAEPDEDGPSEPDPRGEVLAHEAAPVEAPAPTKAPATSHAMAAAPARPRRRRRRRAPVVPNPAAQPGA